MGADLTIEEFRARSREAAIVFRGQADELDRLAGDETLHDPNQGIYEVGLIFKKTERAFETLALELDGEK